MDNDNESGPFTVRIILSGGTVLERDFENMASANRFISDLNLFGMKKDGRIIGVSGINNITAMVNPDHVVCMISEPYVRSGKPEFNVLRVLTPSGDDRS